MAKSLNVKVISECFIRPKLEAGNLSSYFLAPCDLAMLSAHYIQKGLLYAKPDDFSMSTFLEKLKGSLSLTLVHFYPLAGQFETHIDDHQHTSLIYINCNKGPGARLIYATLDMKIADILSPNDVPVIVQSFFDHHKAVNHDGHTRPLLSIQVTELVDGLFIGCSMNHAVADGTSYWHFWKMFSEVHRSQQNTIIPLNLPIHQRWFPDGSDSKVQLPFTDADEFVSRYEAPELRERIFHFSSDSISKLKIRANALAENTKVEVSSLQALSAFVWRAITRARFLKGDEKTSCIMDANMRHRLNPPLAQEYFGNAIWVAKAAATASELLQNDLGWAGLLLHQAVSELTNRALSQVFDEWMKNPLIYQISTFFSPNSVVIGNSPRFDVYGNDFGFGKPVAIRSGYAHKFPGKVTTYPGYEGGGSIDLEICLQPDVMNALESDEEFMVTMV